MSRQIEQALWSLMPSYGSDLPPTLVDLASSLLAQSRQKASTLKAEEEVARLYACANIACDRLKINLDLPPIQARPPVPPRIYKRLYTHLDHVLPKSTPARARPSRTRTPTSKTPGNGNSEQRPLPSRGTPTRDQALSSFRTPTKGGNGTPSKSALRSSTIAVGVGLKPWIKPTIRYMCTESGQPKLASNVVAGMDAIILPWGKEAEDEWVHQNYTALLGAVFFWVSARAKAAAKGTDIARDPTPQQRREIISLLTQARKTVEVTGAGDDDSWEGWADIKPREFNSAVSQVEKQSWLGDWWLGVDDVINATDWDKVTVPQDDEADLVEPIRVRRADTMFQDKYDYLSETRKAEFTTWKTGLLAMMGQSMAGGSGTATEIDTQ